MSNTTDAEMEVATPREDEKKKKLDDAISQHSSTLDAAYAEAQKREGWDGLEKFERSRMFMEKLRTRGVSIDSIDLDVIFEYFDRKEEQKKLEAKDIRNRDTEYGIGDTPYVDVADELKVMRDSTERLLQWYEELTRPRHRYAAPCMPIVQSSGTGKTKLLFEFKRTQEDIQGNYDIKLISCLPKDERRPQARSQVYDVYLDFKGKEKEKLFLQTMIEDMVDKQEKTTPLVLIFDEAQELSRDSSIHMLDLRKLLRRRRKRNVVAFIVGTNLSLVYCHPAEEQRRSSREGLAEGDYFASGNELHPPIFELYTMGCLAKKITISADQSEFVKSIPYGRPLFARMLLGEDELLPREGAGTAEWPLHMKRTVSDSEMVVAATRLLLEQTSPFDSAETLLPFASVWATRVQLGGLSLIHI